MQRNKVRGNCRLHKLVTDNSSFGTNEEETIILSPRTSTFSTSQADQLVDGIPIQQQRLRTSGNAVNKKGWAELNFSGDKPRGTSSTAKGRKLRSSKIEAKDLMKYSLQISPTSPDLTPKSGGVQTKGEEKKQRKKENLDDCHDEYLTPIEKEAKLRHERRMKEKQERERKKDDIFLF